MPLPVIHLRRQLGSCYSDQGGTHRELFGDLICLPNKKVIMTITVIQIKPRETKSKSRYFRKETPLADAHHSCDGTRCGVRRVVGALQQSRVVSTERLLFVSQGSWQLAPHTCGGNASVRWMFQCTVRYVSSASRHTRPHHTPPLLAHFFSLLLHCCGEVRLKSLQSERVTSFTCASCANRTLLV